MADDIQDHVHTALEEAFRLNNEAIKVLKEAIKKTIESVSDDYASTAANSMLAICLRAHNVSARYYITRRRKLKSAAAKAARGIR